MESMFHFPSQRCVQSLGTERRCPAGARMCFPSCKPLYLLQPRPWTRVLQVDCPNSFSSPQSRHSSLKLSVSVEKSKHSITRLRELQLILKESCISKTAFEGNYITFGCPCIKLMLE